MNESVKQSLLRQYRNPQTVKYLRPWQVALAQSFIDEEYYRNRIANPQPGDEERTLKAALAGALVIQGRYDEAMALIDEDAQGIQNLKAAEERDDKEWCNCRNGEQCLHKTDFSAVCTCRKCPILTGKMWSEKYGDFVSVIICPYCGFVNITPETVL